MKQTGEGEANVSAAAADALLARPAAGDAGQQIGYIGKKLGRFLIRSELGHGGMATVYRAHDPQLARDVAVKVMHGFFAGRADLEARFRREANAVAGIRHPSILALYDFSPPRGEEPAYLVSELIEGPDLKQLTGTRGGRLIPEVAVLIAAHVADALGAAHAAGIVHRDVKPDNVLIDRGGGSGSGGRGSGGGGAARVILTDFGVAHVGGMDTMTATGAVLGSPAYMSPEQARGGEVGPTSDVFALGVLLYQLCTGHLPFNGKDPLTVLSAILRGQFVRPAKLEARVGPEFERVILRCLAHDPGERYANGAAAATALRLTIMDAGLGDEGAALRSFLDEPENFEKSLSPRLAAAAVAAAEQAWQRRQLARALAEVGRALAYAPEEPRALALLARLGSRTEIRKRPLLLTGAALAVVVAGAGVAMLTHRGGTGGRAGSEQSAPSKMLVSTEVRVGGPGGGMGSQGVREGRRQEARTSSAAAPGDATVPAHAAHQRDKGTGSMEAAIARGSRRGATSVGAVHLTRLIPSPVGTSEQRDGFVASAGAEESSPIATRGSLPAGTAAIVADIPIAGEPAQEGATLGETAAREKPGPSSGLLLRASQGFCEPSLDDHPPSLRASYSNLAPGAHEVFCTMPQGGAKVLVARYELKAGARPTLIIVRGPEGRPVLARPD